MTLAEIQSVGFHAMIFSFMNKQKEFFFLDGWLNLHKYVKHGKEELCFLLKDERFLMVKNLNPYFRKHLGFIYSAAGWHPEPNSSNACRKIERYKIEIYNKSKFLFFKLKYSL